MSRTINTTAAIVAAARAHTGAARTAGALGGAGCIAATVAALGWPGVTVVAALALLLTATAAWVLGDLKRTYHLVMLIQALRGPITTSSAEVLGLDPGPTHGSGTNR